MVLSKVYQSPAGLLGSLGMKIVDPTLLFTTTRQLGNMRAARGDDL